MVIDKLIEQIKRKKNPSMVGIDPDWNKIPLCYWESADSQAEAIFNWAVDVIDAVADIVPAVKPQMAFFEVFGAEGICVHERIVRYAQSKGLIVVDDSKRNDIGNTAKAYAFAHLAKEGPIDADFLTVSPFLGYDSMEPFFEMAKKDGKGIFVLVKTSNPGSFEISEAVNGQGEKVRNHLAKLVNATGKSHMGKYGYSGIGAVVGATYPKEAKELRKIMKDNFFLVPGFGAQGGRTEDIVSCFNDDGLGAIVSSSRAILYQYQEVSNYNNTEVMYKEIVRGQAQKMQQAIYSELRKNCKKMNY